MSKKHALRIHIKGIVQGVGFRPFVFSLATRMNLTGWVRNTSAGVDIEINGPKNDLVDFVYRLENSHPPLAVLDSIKSDYCKPGTYSSFEILSSESIPGAFIPISPDVSICDDCLHEMFNPEDRRFLYPFINCTNCGPRFTIIKDIPYDRPLTTMSPFDMCQYCRAEYEDPFNRRFHAQPVACPACGPHIWIEDPKENPIDNPSNEHLKPQESLFVIQRTKELLSSGKILAIKGLGGFHLACDATNNKAVTELRRRKLRVDKPFALLIPDIETVELFCYVSDSERELLLSRERPIVLLNEKKGTQIVSGVAPGQKKLGVMLPYTPLHYLLFDRQPIHDGKDKLKALVMTSGNLSEEPIAATNDEARTRLNTLADAFLMHNRDIQTRCDDSVYSVISILEANDREGNNQRSKAKTSIYPIRRSRGYTPNPLRMPVENNHQILATGAELKNTFCLTKGDYAFISHHIGDMQNYETLQSFEAGIEHFEALFKIKPEAIACDLHPNYLATRYAQNRSQLNNLTIYHIQHHHAHIAACMADNNMDGSHPVIGVSFDGIGYGDDGAIWGGEFLLADFNGYQRFAHLKYTPQPGGDAATRKPYRMALAQLWNAGIDWDADLSPVLKLCGDEMTLLRSMLENDINCPKTSSMGRLFDAVAALSGVRGEVNYEGQAAIEFEALVDPVIQETYPFEIQQSSTNNTGSASSPLSIIPDQLFQEIIIDIRRATSLPKIAAKFHNGLALMIVEVCRIMRKEFKVDQVALSGGVWQNQVLLQKTISLLSQSGFKVYIHKNVPTNDGGLALGQAIIASSQLITT